MTYFHIKVWQLAQGVISIAELQLAAHAYAVMVTHIPESMQGRRTAKGSDITP